MFADTDPGCVQDFEDAQARDDTGHGEFDEGFRTRGTPDLGMGAGAEDREGMRGSAWIDWGDESTVVQ